MEPFVPVRPAYGQRSLAELMPSALAVLQVPSAVDRLSLTDRLAGVRKLAVLLVDGLGELLLPVAAASSPVLADVLAGRALAGRETSRQVLTATFPSTTPTSLTSLGTGAPPGEHGVVGFTVNVPGTDRVLVHIDWERDPDPLVWQPLPTQLARAAEAGVAASVVARGAFGGSGLTRAAWRGGRYRPADRPDTIAAEMIAALTVGLGPALVYGYLADLDYAGHRYGVDSGPWRAAASGLDQLLTRLVAGLPPEAALLVTADHGLFDVPASHRFDLAIDARLREGVRLVAGEPRVRYLHPVAGAAADVMATWQAVLGEAAWVGSREQAIEDGWFGPVVSQPHRGRIGEVVVVCQDRYVVLASDREPPSVASLVAYHGGWTAAEMLVPLIAIHRS